MLAQIDHLLHLVGRNHGVPCLPEEDAGVVAKVDDGIAHHLDALVPLASRDISLAVAGRTDLDDAETREGIRIHLLRRNVHPAHVVAVALADHSGGVVVHPVGIACADASPFIGRALGKSLEVDELFVDVKAARARAALELGLAEASLQAIDIDHFPVHFQYGVDVVKVGVFDAPKARVGDGAGGGHDAFFAVHHVNRIAIELHTNASVVVDDDGREAHLRTVARGVVDLGIDGDVGGLLRDVEVAGVDVDALALQAVVEGQGLVDLARDMQPDMAVDAAVVGIEVVPAPTQGVPSAFFGLAMQTARSL